jgi:hypothetical protein
LSKYSHECRTQPSELVLLDQLVQVHTQQLEYQAKMLSMNEGIF